MKHLKIFLTIITLTLFTGVTPKVYFDDTGKELFTKQAYDDEGKYSVSTDFPVLDICIFLDKYKFSKFNNAPTETWNCRSKNNSEGFRLMLANCTKKEETIVSCSNMIREILYQSKSDPSKQEDYWYNSNKELHEQVLKDINDTNKWLKLTTTDKEFVILIPKNKYPIIKDVTQKNINEIEKIGLNSEILQELISIDDEFCIVSEKAQQERIEKISQENPELKRLGLIAHETLSEIFADNKEAKKIMKRVYLAGHGMYQEQMQSNINGPMPLKTPEEIKDVEFKREKNACIAQLWPDQYVTLLEKLNKTGCSFLYVNSCYSSAFNALTCQSANFYKEKNIFKKFELTTKSTSFITVLEPLPETCTAVGGGPINIDDFFIEINNFFENEYSSLSKSRSDISETDILTGEKVKSKKTNKLEKKKASPKQISLIEQKPWLIDSISSIPQKIWKTNTSARFPGLPFFRVCMPDINYFQYKLDSASGFTPEVNSAKIDILLLNLNKELDLKNSQISYEEKLKLVFDKAKQENLEDMNDTEIKNTIKINNNHLSTKIDNLFLIKQNKIIDQNKIKHFETGNKQILIYPSVINLPLKIYNQSAKIISMIPGRAQHYIKEIMLCEELNKTNFDRTFLSGQDVTKLYFIQELSCLKDNSKLKNLVIKIEKGTTEYIYQDQESGKYFNKKGIEIDEKTAKETIKNWILLTMPAQEAIYEATSGIEDTNDFLIEINKAFKDMFDIKKIPGGATPEQKKKNKLAVEELAKKYYEHQ